MKRQQFRLFPDQSICEPFGRHWQMGSLAGAAHLCPKEDPMRTEISCRRRCFLILRCRLFLSCACRRAQWLDCSPTNRERELGLDRRETVREETLIQIFGLVATFWLCSTALDVPLAAPATTPSTSRSTTFWLCSTALDVPLAAPATTPSTIIRLFKRLSHASVSSYVLFGSCEWLIISGSIPEREPERRLQHPRKAAGAME
eukprot:maker-scaffold_151-snap-gene-0.1-mRNA-1 protein AED:0.41 eAED:0.80 QI:0/0/0/1/0/0/9/0/201